MIQAIVFRMGKNCVADSIAHIMNYLALAKKGIHILQYHGQSESDE